MAELSCCDEAHYCIYGVDAVVYVDWSERRDDAARGRRRMAGEEAKGSKPWLNVWGSRRYLFTTVLFLHGDLMD